MVTVNLAYTAPINPAGAEPVLTESQVWAGLQRKVRRAHEFVPVITSCEVLSEGKTDDGDKVKVVREVVFTPDGPRPGGGTIKEVCVHYPPARVDFQQENGSTITNLVSKGPKGELLMTYSFEWRHPDVEEGSAKAAELKEAHMKGAKIAVEGTIDTIRRLVKEGEIQ
ncbi:hypothetical protein DL764_004864 [Monosporascus ibericus]|uniref:DUF1857-domain-containing protein n=1 Tax=Monosporascus ibericus TaxID=155417 RepID=A0A4Q4TDS2_9PEZI|nr:hypothetical protein DL764_004864 [Monosporascus ibericus]